MDVECALAPTITCYDDQTQPLCHLTPMELVEKEDGLWSSDCYVCESPSRFGSPTYYYHCKICEFLVHKSCTKFPKDTVHPFHPKHRLFLYFSYVRLYCSSCERGCYKFNFQCKKCDVNVCSRCIFLRPCIRYQGHDHLLCYVRRSYALTSCDAHDAYCKQYSMDGLCEFDWSRNHVLRCVPCKFNVHLLCGPLPPSVIKHKCQIHPLTLVDSMIEDDSGEYYCDSCEMERDPRLCVYYCEGCKYIAHVQCMISEVLHVLKGELKDVELRIVGQSKLDTEIMEKNLVLDKDKEENALAVGEEGKANSMTLMDLVSRLSEKELDDLHLELVKYKTYRILEKHQPVLEVQDYIQEFINWLHNSNYSSRRFQLAADDLKVKIVNVGKYKVTHNFAHILKDLLAKYGDVSGGDELMLSIEMKSMAFYLLCGLIHSLHKTMLVDVTQNLLKDWFLRLKVLESNGFKIDFVRSHLEKILPSYLVFEAERVIDKDKKLLDENIVDLQKKIQRMVAEMEKCKKNHEKLCEIYKKTTKFMEDGESLISKYKIVGDGLF